MADALGMRKLMTAWMPYMAERDAIGPVPSRPSCMEWRMLSTTLPSCRMTMIPEAKPTTRAADRMSLAPAMSSSAMRLPEKPAMMPHTRPITRKRPVISGRYHSHCVTPTTSRITVTPRTARMALWRPVSGSGTGADSRVKPSFFRVLEAYRSTNTTSKAVRMNQQTRRYPIPEKRGRSAIPWAIPTVKGFRKALEKPTLEATYTMSMAMKAS